MQSMDFPYNIKKCKSFGILLIVLVVGY